MEGDPVLIHSSRNWLAVATAAGFIRIYSLSSKETRQEYHSKYVVEALDEFHRFSSMKVNISGNRVACTYFATPLKSGDRILVWDAEADLIAYFSFTLGMTDQQQYEAEAELASSQGRPVTAAARFDLALSTCTIAFRTETCVGMEFPTNERFRERFMSSIFKKERPQHLLTFSLAPQNSIPGLFGFSTQSKIRNS
ncbi:hypothetical protein ANCCAN_29853 [Ancylostoma caninum]|uniref:IFT140 second beta-propeller domain-containing protein n=1 Tax=Ancylostoma caninum TaxID=29170 RepID=A0A368F0D0_ANCCA|nr:hypothetical protein ANCCAN_29853 [Ancylostoma caninum]